MSMFSIDCTSCRRWINYSFLAVMTLSAIGVLATPAHAATVVANFDDGNTNAAVDGYVGTPGGGWATSWVENANSRVASINNTVLNASPINGGGNYLSNTITTVSGTSGSDDARYAVGRDFSDGINLAIPYRFEFTVRIDEDLTTFTDNADRFMIFDGDSDRNTAGSTNTWSIFAHGGVGGNAPASVVGQWAFYDGDNNGSFDGINNLVDTNISLTQGGVYEFTIDVYPINGGVDGVTWDGTVSDGTDTFMQTGMGGRWDDNLDSTYLWFSTRTSDFDEQRSWSMDSITISQLPEPSMFVLAALGSVLLMGGCKRIGG